MISAALQRKRPPLRRPYCLMGSGQVIGADLRRSSFDLASSSIRALDHFLFALRVGVKPSQPYLDFLHSPFDVLEHGRLLDAKTGSQHKLKSQVPHAKLFPVAAYGMVPFAELGPVSFVTFWTKPDCAGGGCDAQAAAVQAADHTSRSIGRMGYRSPEPSRPTSRRARAGRAPQEGKPSRQRLPSGGMGQLGGIGTTEVGASAGA